MMKKMRYALIGIYLTAFFPVKSAINEEEFIAQFWLFKDFEYLISKGDSFFDTALSKAQEVKSNGSKGVTYYRDYAAGLKKAREVYHAVEGLFWDQKNAFTFRECLSAEMIDRKEEQLYSLLPELTGKSFRATTTEEKKNALEKSIGTERANFLLSIFKFEKKWHDIAARSLTTESTGISSTQLDRQRAARIMRRNEVISQEIALIDSRKVEIATSFERDTEKFNRLFRGLVEKQSEGFGTYKWSLVSATDWNTIVNPGLPRSIYDLLILELLQIQAKIDLLYSDALTAQAKNNLFNISTQCRNLSQEILIGRISNTQTLLSAATSLMKSMLEKMSSDIRYDEAIKKPTLLYESIQRLTALAQRALASAPHLLINYFTNDKDRLRAGATNNERKTLINALNKVRQQAESFFTIFTQLVAFIKTQNDEMQKVIGADPFDKRISALTFKFVGDLYDELLYDYQGIITLGTARTRNPLVLETKNPTTATREAIVTAATLPIVPSRQSGAMRGDSEIPAPSAATVPAARSRKIPETRSTGGSRAEVYPETDPDRARPAPYFGDIPASKAIDNTRIKVNTLFEKIYNFLFISDKRLSDFDPSNEILEKKETKNSNIIELTFKKNESASRGKAIEQFIFYPLEKQLFEAFSIAISSTKKHVIKNLGPKNKVTVTKILLIMPKNSSERSYVEFQFINEGNTQFSLKSFIKYIIKDYLIPEKSTFDTIKEALSKKDLYNFDVTTQYFGFSTVTNDTFKQFSTQSMDYFVLTPKDANVSAKSAEVTFYPNQDKATQAFIECAQAIKKDKNLYLLENIQDIALFLPQKSEPLIKIRVVKDEDDQNISRIIELVQETFKPENAWLNPDIKPPIVLSKSEHILKLKNNTFLNKKAYEEIYNSSYFLQTQAQNTLFNNKAITKITVTPRNIEEIKKIMTFINEQYPSKNAIIMPALKDIIANNELIIDIYISTSKKNKIFQSTINYLKKITRVSSSEQMKIEKKRRKIDDSPTEYEIEFEE